MAHPREGWQGHGVPRKLTRRSFLQGTAGALAALGAAPLLGACSSALAGTGTVPLPRPYNPVKWPLFPDNHAIASGLPQEEGATLQIYCWVAYINQSVVNAFAKKHKVKVQITTFNTMNEAMSKLRSGLSYDLLIGATVDVLGQLIESKLVQPLNHSYIPNITQAWPDFTNPFYDQGWQYTVPYTIYTTGIAWRKDLVDENPYALRNPWAMPWQAKYKGRVAILDDYRESISLGLMKNGIFDLNTTDYKQIGTSRRALEELSQPGQRPDRQQRLHRGPRRGHLDPPRLVRRHGGGRVLHAQGGLGHQGGLLVPPRRQGTGRERHQRRAPLGHQPGAGPHVP